jgi:metal-responsive CopG/Arc/MetJ family transcriptional regulator
VGGTPGELVMNAEVVRMNITLPKDVAESLTLVAGLRKRSRFIAEAIAKRIERTRKAALEKALEEGYRAVGQESIDLSKEFATVDLEGWDGY